MHDVTRPILLVEDDDSDAQLSIQALQSNHLYNAIHRVSDGEEALDYLFYKGKFLEREKVMPAVMLLDLKMPKVSGIEVLKKVRSDNTTSALPVVILTSSKEESDLIGTYKLGINAYVVKPVDFDQFVRAIKEVGAFWGVINEPPPF